MMVSREVANMGMLEIFKKINSNKGQKLGRSYVIFGKTISLRDYFAEETK
jgi:glycerol-3-phosphate O-acyltransferase